MEFAKVNVDVRSAASKGHARRVRQSGQVPGVLYGRKREPIAVTFNEKELIGSLDKDKRRNTVLKLTVRDAGKSEEVTAMVRDAQINPLSRRLVHVDFLAVDLNAEVRVTVPLVLTGKPVGVTNGGNLHQSMHLVPIAAKPAAIPTKLEVDVSALDIGVALDAKEAIASVVAPKAEKVEETAAAPVEGAVPAEGAAAPAAGGAAPGAAPGAAAAPAAGGDKKEGGGKKK